MIQAPNPRALSILRFAILSLVAAFTAQAALAQNWPQFRGEGARGIAEGKPLPVEWDGESGEGILWRTPIPGLGHSSPVIWGDKLFLTTAVSEKDDAGIRTGLYGDIDPVKDDSSHRFDVYCLDRHTGKVLWTKTAIETVPQVKRHLKSTHANPTVATDGENLVVLFGSEGLYVYDLEGNLRWQKNLGLLDSGFFMVPDAQWGFGSSPVLVDGRVIVQADIQKGSFLAAFDVKDGKELWRTSRDEVPTWSTPTVHDDGSRKQVIVNGFKHIGGYDFETGAELWRMAGTGDIPTPTPFVVDNLIYLTSAHGGGNPIYVIPTNAKGTLEPDQLPWTQERGGSYLPTTIVYDGLYYGGRDNGVLGVYDAKTGERHYEARIGEGNYSFVASPVAGDGKLYYSSEDGVIFVLAAGKELNILAENDIGGRILASPAIADGTLYVRTLDELVAVRGASEAPPPPLSAAEKAALIEEAGAPLFDGMGDHHHSITTAHPGAQRYFNQGMVLAFAFNHAESIRAFQAAQRLDDDCAMCFWGEALATGPNINVTSNGKAVMSDDERTAAYAALQKAIARRDKASEAERDYIDALATRYNGDPATEREPLDRAYAEAMAELAAKYPADDDAQSLYAEAVMNTMPWDYWLDGENPRPEAAEVISTLETVLDRSPAHPLALHLYIHAVEASSNPGRAEAAADRLADLVPGAGHLVHMPAHIYWRVGRYHDASEANVKAAAVDEAYIAQCNAQGFYPALYYPHNIHFLWAASSMEGRSAVAIEAARKLAANVRLEMIEEFPPVEFFHTIPLLALTQFGQWDAILAEPQPREDLEFSNAIWHYARATAYARQGDLARAKAEHAALVPLLETDKILALDGSDYPASVILDVANSLVEGEIALAGDDLAGAIEHFEQAVATQDSLPYMEPPFWYYPTRQSLGAALLAAGQDAEAEAVYRRDLEDYPRNGWSLFGLVQSLERQDKEEDAAAARQRFDAAWSLADVELTGSRI